VKRAAALLLVLVAQALACAPPARPDPPLVYHSPADDGVMHAQPSTVAPGGPTTLHLYIGAGTTPSTSAPCLAGDGEEVCGYLLRLASTGLGLVSFAPADSDVLFGLQANRLDASGGDPATGQLGPTKVGDLVIDAAAPGGALVLEVADFATTTLSLSSAPTPVSIVQVPEPGAAATMACGLLVLALVRRWRVGGR
jgi:hypothetical protein